MSNVKALLNWLLWLIVTGIIVFLAIWYGTGERAWYAGEVRGHQVDEYFNQLEQDR